LPSFPRRRESHKIFKAYINNEIAALTGMMEYERGKIPQIIISDFF
jgi:hypothetical protein